MCSSITSGSKQRVGVATGLDIARLDAQLAGERQQAAASQYAVEHAKLNLFNNLLAPPYETLLALTDDFHHDVLNPPAVQAAVEEALRQRLEVSAQVTRVRATEPTIPPSPASVCRRSWRKEPTASLGIAGTTASTRTAWRC